VTTRKKALVLSGGGGRGAYHVGVIEALVEQGWMEDGKGPDIIAGTSIGAINAAALASGLTVARLRECWLAMHTEDVHRLSNELPAIARPLLRFLLRSVLTSNAHGGSAGEALPDEDRNMSAKGLFERLGSVFHMRPFRSLLDTTPWRYTLDQWMDFDRINSPDAPALLLTATDLQRGTLQVFCNREHQGQPADTLGLDHLMASSSIPAVYPWTEIDDAKYWDGAVLANTPLGGVIDLAGTDDVDIMVVMMTPWYDNPEDAPAQALQPPHDLVQALALTLDWSLLASYRMALKLLQSYNELVDAAEKLERAADQTGDESLRIISSRLRRVSLPTVIAPQEFMPMEWIIDYEEATHHKLFAMGKADAERTLAQRANQAT
jgi:NTE family protein